MSKQEENVNPENSIEEEVDEIEEGARPEEESTEAVVDDSAVEETPPTPEEQLAEAEAKASEYLDGWQRARAELANFKKRTERERELWKQTLQSDILIGLLPVVDDFDRALENKPALSEGDGASEWLGGIELIHRKLVGQLEELGVSTIAALNEPFDPAYHEAVMESESADHQPGHVMEVIRKGYMIGDKVLRPAMVVVAK
ncbi:MAG: nucleotide exchange factor GrpE [Anaerolineae bacterium]|nr:nucleotide exchange factor GrpE [Anaerolineae bacterium]